MNTQYAQIANAYEASFKIPLRKESEGYSFFRLLGDPGGKSVLDLACGTGFYTREIKKRGAETVVGVDNSEDMLRIAEAVEAENPLGIRYVTQDIVNMDNLGSFDICTAMYLMNYAPDKASLVNMCKKIAENLKPGGRLISFQLNPDINLDDGYYKKYEMLAYGNNGLKDADNYEFALILSGEISPRIKAFYWSRESLEFALQEAGFNSLNWVAPQVSKTGIETFGAQHWQDYLDYPHCLFIDCVK